MFWCGYKTLNFGETENSEMGANIEANNKKTLDEPALC